MLFWTLRVCYLRNRAVIAAVLLLQIAGVTSAGSQIVYVDDDAPPNGDGTSWATAFRFLQDALQSVSGPSEVRIAQGTYQPDRSEANPTGTGDLLARFSMTAANVDILGGFAGLTEADPNVRDIELYPTILSGDLNGDDLPGFVNVADNSYRVMQISGPVNGALDGVTVTAGNADGFSLPNWRGAGLSLGNDSEMVVRNCKFIRNMATREGAGIWVQSSPCTIEDCVFEGNWTSSVGGGMSIGFSTVLAEVRRCRFIGNRALNGSMGGGAGLSIGRNHFRVEDCDFMGNTNGGAGFDAQVEGTVTNCRFFGNTQTSGGAGMVLFGNVTVMNCLIEGNTLTIAPSPNSGGGVQASGNAKLINCTIADNTGGGARLAATVQCSNCIFWGNSDFDGNGESSQLTILPPTAGFQINHSCVQGWTKLLGGTGNHGLDPLFVDPDGADDVLGNEDDDFQLGDGSPCIDAGDNAALPPDLSDFDQDTFTVEEPVPFDLEGVARTADDPLVADTGAGIAPIVDMGPYEVGGGSVDGGTFIGPSNSSWFTPTNWLSGEIPNSATDVFISTTVNVDDVGAMARNVLVQNGGTLVIADGTLDVEGLIRIQPGGTVIIDDANAVLRVQSIEVQSGASIDFDAGQCIVDGGTWTQDATLVIGCPGPATLTLLNGGSITASPHITLCGMGTIEGVGTINGDVNVFGTLRPDHLTVNGNVTFNNGSTLLINVAGYTPIIEFSRIDASGSVAIDGTLDVVVPGAIMPALQSIDFVVATSVTGSFDSVLLPTPPSSHAFSLFIGTTYLRLFVVPTTPRLYVDSTAKLNGDGAGWKTAALDLSFALQAAEASGTVNEIWVRAGTYIPTEVTNPADAVPQRTATFTLPSGVAVYGGFDGTETSLEQRDFENNISRIEGDRLGDDNGTFNNRFDNIRQLVTITDAIGVTLDGFTIASGEASLNYKAGALFAGSSEVTLSNLRFTRNRAEGGGGGAPCVRFEDADVTVVDCVFEENGNGIEAISSSTVEIADSTFLNNGVLNNRRGGMLISNATVSLTDVLFQGNDSSDPGSGLAISNFSDVTATNCQFVANESSSTVAGLYGASSTVELIGCLFDGNFDSDTPNTGGGGAEFASGSISVVNCQFTNNTTRRGLDVGATTSAVIKGCHFENNSGGLSIVMNENSTLQDCGFVNNTARLGAGLILYPAQPVNQSTTVINCTFTGNNATDTSSSDSIGGGAYISHTQTNPATGTVRFLDCTFQDNMSEDFSGAIGRSSYIPVYLENCTFEDDTAPVGAGVFVNGRYSLTGIEATFKTSSDVDTVAAISPGAPAGATAADLVGEFTIESVLRFLLRADEPNDNPFLEIDMLGTSTSNYDHIVAASGAIELDGGLRVSLHDGFEPQAGDVFDFLMSPSVSGDFAVAALPALAPNLTMSLDHHAAGVSLEVANAAAIGVDGPTLSSAAGTPLAPVVADFDHDGDDDIAVFVRSVPSGSTLFVFRNNGSDVGGNWLGFTVTQQNVTSLPVPVQLVGGDFDGDSYIDLAVYDQLGLIMFMLNDGSGNATFSTFSIVPAPTNVLKMVVGQFNNDDAADYALAMATSNTVNTYYNSGVATFTAGVVLAGETDMLDAIAADMDNDGTDDLVMLRGGTSPRLSTRLAQPAISTFETSIPKTIDTALSRIAAFDLNNNGFLDIVGVSQSAGVMYIFANKDLGDGLLGTVCRFDIGGGPMALDAADLDGDGDKDILILDQVVPGLPSVRFARNNLAEVETIAIANPIDLIADVPIRWLNVGALSDDAAGDLLLTSISTSATMADVNVYLGAPILKQLCPADIVSSSTFQPPADGQVDGADLAYMLGEWGSNPGSLADLVNSSTFLPPPDGLVDGADLAVLLGAWGACE